MTENEIHYFSARATPYKLINIRAHNAIIQVNPDLSIMNLKWNPLTEMEDFKAGWLLAISIIKKFQIRRILHNATNIPYLSIESYIWMLKVVVPQFVAQKVLKVSRVVTPEPMAELVLGKYLSRIQEASQSSPCKCRFFTDQDTAWFWLNS